MSHVIVFIAVTGLYIYHKYVLLQHFLPSTEFSRLARDYL